MQLFLDTANVEEIRQGVRMGVISGVTTNPSLAAREGIGDMRIYREIVTEICDIVQGPVSAEVISTDVEGMVAEALDIAAWHPHAVAKIPSTQKGFEAMATVTRKGVKVNQTLCFSVNQAILGAQAGASFVSPFVGRLDDIGQDGMELVADIVEVFYRYGIKTQVMAASIRHPLHCVDAAKVGADVATIPYKVLMQMTQHPLTDSGVMRFSEDWKQVIKA